MDTTQIVKEFNNWLESETARQHLRNIEDEKKEVQKLMARLDSMNKSS